jgi:SHS2 domain-containing protein
MPHRYLEDMAIADVAFEAWGQTAEEMLVSACDATMNAMVENPESVLAGEYRGFQIDDAEMDLLLLQVLQELIFYKDAESLLLRVQALQLRQHAKGWTAIVETCGEFIDPARHNLIVDVKAVTLHRLQVTHASDCWRATVVLDV